ncbi:MAG: hypothetical protein A3I20_01170 [Candidatus Portnoybacteria bacterium RIFCSPLOWO2_02_FULL_40_15]|uniref:PKD domain-containing protein n=1 Tax=Candidatus Portnoybacteria bacterium RIFCSPLOWO2_02_FULL_40_15 TaxID=1802002 RepID=A0A1G2FTX4_9BACT|nr:MAG: hypothetical protein A3I20_01170 [Candidatus Portnoybacteria bacterium RIFCSPLOWO2_02_FULL_40_15]
MKKISLRIITGLTAFLVLAGPVGAGLNIEIIDTGNTRERIAPNPELREIRDLLRGEYARDEIVVKFKNSRKPFEIIKVSEDKLTEKLAEYLNDENVEYVEPNYIARAFWTPNDPNFSYQWHLGGFDKGGINTEAAWDVLGAPGLPGQGVAVAIVDTGIAYENYSSYQQATDLAQTCFVNGYDFVNNDSHPNDDNGHGTHVAGTAAQSTNNSLGVAGIAFKSCLMPVKVLNSSGSGTYTQVANGIRFAADNGAKVINLSLGGSSPSITLEQAVAYAYNKGVTIAAAAGNDSSSSISYPAAYNNYVIAVGATRYDKTLAYYSNYGQDLDLVAPGGDTTVDQNKDGYVDGILQQTFTKRGWLIQWGHYFFQGTSMASPHVAGAAALVISNGKATVPDDVRTALQTTVKDLGPTGWDNTYGWGLIDAAAALNYSPGPVDNVNDAPIANAGPNQSAYVGDVVSFDGSSSSDPDGLIVSYEWNFGDGTTASGAVVTHTYSQAQTYTATLTVTDNGGLTGADTALVVISEKPIAPTAVVNIELSKELRFKRWRANALVSVIDKNGIAIAGAVVEGAWSGLFNKNVSGPTNTNGEINFKTDWIRINGLETFTVNKIARDGQTYLLEGEITDSISN